MVRRLPQRWQQGLKRFYYRWQMRHGRFHAGEPEYDLLARFLSPGDWVLDIGANVGHYTVKFSQLVGEQGRVIALEPVPETFELLAANVAGVSAKNVTLMNLAASDQARVSGMTIPRFGDGSTNYYQARLTPAPTALAVLCFPIDCLTLPHGIRLAKIDAEGHELSVLRGMGELLERDHPILIVEDSDPDVSEFLKRFGYHGQKLPGSPNLLFCPDREAFRASAISA